MSSDRSRVEFPANGQSRDHVMALMQSRRSGDIAWREARTFSLVYPTGRDDVDELLVAANEAYVFENALNPLRFPSLGLMEREVVSMVGSLLHAPDGSGGAFSSGGTESIVLSVLSAREKARARGVTGGRVVTPISAHPAFAKAAHLLDLELVTTPLREDFTADVAAWEAALTPDTVLAMGSAYSYPHGVVDSISTMSEAAGERGIPFHTDACIGGFVLPFLEDLGVPVPQWDFRAAGVTQISADVHKYGYATKGASVITYRDRADLRGQVFTYNDWPGGMYRTPSLAGARAASPIAAAWSVMNYLGRDGYDDLARDLMATTAQFAAGISAVSGLRILGQPIGPLLAFTSDSVDINAVGDVMDDRGWGLGRVHQPEGLQMMIAPHHRASVSDFLDDLAYAVAHPARSTRQRGGYNT